MIRLDLENSFAPLIIDRKRLHLVVYTELMIDPLFPS